MAVAYLKYLHGKSGISRSSTGCFTEEIEARMDSEQRIHPWFALHVRTRREHIVCSHLRSKGYEYFLPLYKCNRIWSDRIKELALPLFPGYVFCRLDPQDRLPIMVIPGVFEIVGNARNPLAVDDSEIAAIQLVVKSGLPYEPWPFLPVGTRVRIDHGALQGIEGILTGVKSRFRVVVSVTLLQRSVALEVDRAWVSPADRECVSHPISLLSDPLPIASGLQISCGTQSRQLPTESR